MTSAQAVATLVSGRVAAGAPVLVVGGEGLRVALTERGLRPTATAEDAAAVVQGFAPDVSWTLAGRGRVRRHGRPAVAREQPGRDDPDTARHRAGQRRAGPGHRRGDRAPAGRGGRQAGDPAARRGGPAHRRAPSDRRRGPARHRHRGREQRRGAQPARADRRRRPRRPRAGEGRVAAHVRLDGAGGRSPRAAPGRRRAGRRLVVRRLAGAARHALRAAGCRSRAREPRWTGCERSAWRPGRGSRCRRTRLPGWSRPSGSEGRSIAGGGRSEPLRASSAA